MQGNAIYFLFTTILHTCPSFPSPFQTRASMTTVCFCPNFGGMGSISGVVQVQIFFSKKRGPYSIFEMLGTNILVQIWPTFFCPNFQYIPNFVKFFRSKFWYKFQYGPNFVFRNCTDSSKIVDPKSWILP